MRRIAALVWIVALVILVCGAAVADAVERGGARGGLRPHEISAHGQAARAGKKPGLGGPAGSGGGTVQLPAWIPPDLQIGQWFRVPNTNLRSVPPVVDTDSQAAPYNAGITGGNNTCALRAYSGFATNDAGTKVFVFGGGHSASWRNDILQIDMSSDSPGWTYRATATAWNVINEDFRSAAQAGPWLYDPVTQGERGARKLNSGLAGLWPLFRSDGSVAQWADKYPDDTPISTHTALRNLYNEQKDAVYNIGVGVGTLGGGLYVQNPPAGAASKIYSVAKYANGTWTYPVPEGSGDPNQPEYATAPYFSYTAPVAKHGTKAYVWASNNYADLFLFDTSAEQWTRLGVQVGVAWNDTQAMLGYDHTRNRLLATNNAGAWVVDLNTTPPTKTQITIAGKFNTGSGNLLYDERGDRFLFVQGQYANGSVKTYAIDAGLTSPSVAELTTSVYGAHQPAMQDGRDNYGTFLIPEYGLLVWQANEPTAPEANDCYLYILKLHEPQVSSVGGIGGVNQIGRMWS